MQEPSRVHALMLAIALAAPVDRARAEELYTNAEREEHDLDLDAALAHYEESIAADPSNRWALRATARARWLRLRSDGGFAPLVALERLRRDPNSQRDPAAIDALARALEDFPAGEVRFEARMFVAEAYASRLDRPADAARELDALLDEPKGDPPIRAQAATRLVDIALARGDAATASRAAARSHDAQLTRRVAQWIRRRWIERLAVATLAAFIVLSLVTIARRFVARKTELGELRAFVPHAVVVCAYLALVAAALAGAFERGHTLPFVLVPAVTFPIALVARAWALAGSTSSSARAARAALSAIAVASAAFLVLDRIDVRYLESFGL